MRIRTLLGIGVALSAACLMWLNSAGIQADDGVKLYGEAGAVKKMTATDVGDLQKILSAAKLEKKDIKRAKILALVIGLNAQATGDMALHEQAGKVLAALTDDKTADAKKAAAGLDSASGPGKSTDLVKHLFDAASKDWDIDLTMQLFKTPRAGGLGIESKIKKWAEDGVKAGDLAAIANAAQKSAIIGLSAEKMDPPQAKKQFKADWEKYSKDLQAASADAISAAGKKDTAAAKTAIERMDKACTACHEKFK
jgi:hypothetical protein